MIIEMLAWPGADSISANEKISLAPYSSISRQWQSLIEPIQSKHLIIHQFDIAKFSRIVTGPRRIYLQHSWLRIRLNKYDCQSCRSEESQEEIRCQNLTYTRAIWNLYEVLSSPSWSDKRGVTLELSAHSPSDAIHYGKDLKMREFDTAWEKGGGGSGKTPKTHAQRSIPRLARRAELSATSTSWCEGQAVRKLPRSEFLQKCRLLHDDRREAARC